MHFSLPFALDVYTITGARTGSVIESNCYSGTSEVLNYRDISLIAILHQSNDPKRGRFLIAVIRFNLIKGHRADDSKYAESLLHMERDENRMMCPTFYLVVLAILKDALELINNIDELFNPPE